MKNKKVLSILLIIVSVALAIISFVLLPDTVVIQFSAGSSNVTTAPKFLAVLLPTALGISGAIAAIASKESETSRGKALLVSGVGILVFVIMLIVNLAGR